MSVTLSQAITKLIEKWTPLTAQNLQIDSEIETIELAGYIIDEQMTIASALRTLATAYNFIFQENNGVLKIKLRANSDIIKIDSTLLPFFEISNFQQTQRAYVTKYFNNNALLKKIDVRYYDSTKEFQICDQVEVGNNYAIETTETIDLNLTLTPAEARTIARRIYFENYLNRNEIRLQLAPSYIYLQEQDVLEIDDIKIRINKIERGFNGLLMIEGIIEKTMELSFSMAAQYGEYQQQQLVGLPEMKILFLDIPPQNLAESSSIGFYTAGILITNIALTDWPGGTLFWDKFGVDEYEELMTQNFATTSFAIKDTIPAGPIGYFDDKNEIEIELLSGQLESISELSLLNGRNRIYVGGEILAFQTVTNLGGNTYKLSRLLRGLCNTEDMVDNHQSDEIGILLTDIDFCDLELSDLNIEKNYKFVPVGQTIDDVDVQKFTATGKTLKPFSPCHVTGQKNDSGDWIINWVRRSRLPFADNPSGVPLEEPFEKYEIDIYKQETVVRTITVEAQTSATYTADQQIEDFGNLQDEIVLKIYQLSTIVGRGKGKDAIL